MQPNDLPFVDQTQTTTTHGLTNRYNVAPAQCAVCHKLNCPLRSHRQYSLRIAERRQVDVSNRFPPQIHPERADPFAETPVEMDNALQELYFQFWQPWNPSFKGVERHLFPVPRYRAFMQVARRDTPLFFGLLALVATQSSRIRHGYIGEQAVALQNRTIQEQGKAILAGEPSDARIGTALAILSNQLATGDFKSMPPHMEMVEIFVRRRGGVEYLGMEGLLTDNIMYADHTFAIHYNRSVKYPSTLPALPYPYLSNVAPFLTGNAIKDLAQSGAISPDMETAARDFAICLAVFDKAAHRVATPTEGQYVHYLCPVVEYELAELNAENHDTNTLDNCLTIALLLLNHVLLRNYGAPSPVVRILELRLWAYLESADGTQLKDTNRDLLVWLIFTGISSSTRDTCPYIEKAISMLVPFQKSYCWASFEDVCSLLSSYIWSRPTQYDVSKNLWEMAVARANESELVIR